MIPNDNNNFTMTSHQRVDLQKQLAHFEGLYNQLKPKSRYISEIIIEDYNDQL